MVVDDHALVGRGLRDLLDGVEGIKLHGVFVGHHELWSLRKVS